MDQKKRLVLVLALLLGLGLLALLGGMLGRKPGTGLRTEAEDTGLRCAYDGTKLRPLYQVDAYLVGGKTRSFCSIYCAMKWYENNKDQAIYFTVVDEMTGQKFDSTLGYYVESDVVTVPEVKNRIHAFAVKEDVLTHARQFNGRPIPNPFGTAFALPKYAQLDKLRVGAPALPDALPLRLGIFRPIFKENMLDVGVTSYSDEEEGIRLFSEGALEGFICDLPTALVLTRDVHTKARIVKNVLRTNPYRALFALVGGSQMQPERIRALEGSIIAIPRGLSFRFYGEYFLKMLDIPLSRVRLLETLNQAEAWSLLENGEVVAAVLRTPYTEMAGERKRSYLADDRSTPWMSVMVFRQEVIEHKRKVLEKFIFGLEQSVLALNLKPNEFRPLLREKGGIPPGIEKKFPMPIFEGANCPSPEELRGILAWLDQKGLLRKDTPYAELIDTGFLPDPNDVGLAFCCR